MIQGRVLSIMKAFTNVSSDPRTEIIKATKKGKLSFEMQRDEERKARLKAKYLEEEGTKEDTESAGGESEKRGKITSGRKTFDIPRSKSPKSKPAKPLTVAEYIRTKVHTPSTVSRDSPGRAEKIESYRKMDVVLPTVVPSQAPASLNAPENGLSNCMTIIKSHKPNNSMTRIAQARYNARKIHALRASSTNATPKAP